MKNLSCSVLIILAASLHAQMPEPMPLAHGNMPGEPHHHLKIENEYVRAYYVEVPPHEATQLHQHDHDYIYVSLGPSDVINAPLNKPEMHLQLKDGEMHFTRGGFAHVARNLSNAPFRNVTIELLKPQTNLRNACAEVAPGNKGHCSIERKHNSYINAALFRTAEINVFLVILQPKAALQEFPDRDRLVVALDRAALVTQMKGKDEENLTGGSSVWMPRLTAQTIRNSADSASSFLSISFKDSAPKRIY